MSPLIQIRTSRNYRIAGSLYIVPLRQSFALDRFVREVWRPGMQNSELSKHIPAPLRAMSFTQMLAEWASAHWEEFKQ